MAELKLDDTVYTYDQLEKKYSSFFSPTVEIIVNNTKIIRETPAAISKVSVETSIDSVADTFSFVVTNAFDIVKREFMWIDDYFAVGKEIEIQMGYVDKLETVFIGLITSLSITCDDNNPSLTVKGMDKMFLMMTGNKAKAWDKKKYSEIAKELSGKYGLKPEVDDTPNKIINQTKMEYQTDFALLSEMAKKSDFDFFVLGKSMYFCKPKTASPVVNLMWGISLRSFSAEVNISSQVSTYTVRSMIVNKVEVAESVAASSTIKKIGTNTKTGADIVASIGSYFDKYESSSVMDSVEESKALAVAKLNEISKQLISGSGESIGLPEIKAGRKIKLEGLGKKLSQEFYVKSVTHTFDQSGYVTSFQVKGNAI